jgi:hypothetical protein
MRTPVIQNGMVVGSGVIEHAMAVAFSMKDSVGLP